MAEHHELVAELQAVEKMVTQDRLKHARKRRQQQMKKWNQYEKQLEKEQNKKNKKNVQIQAKKPKKNRVMFVNSFMLLEAAARNDVEEVRELLKQGVSPDVTNEDGLTALHQCCIDDFEQMALVLLDFDANVNARDSELWTPLHAAATCAHVNMCRILVNNGADLLAVNADGNMPYDICEDEVTLDYIESEMAKRNVTQELIDETRLSTEQWMLEDLQKLAQKGGDMEFRGRSGETPLHVAAANGYLRVAEFLIEHRVTVDVQDEDQWQPIHAAACWCHPQVLELLVKHGADLEAKTRTGETCSDICEDPELRERITELKSEASKREHPITIKRRRSNPRSSFSNSASSLYNSNTSLSEKNPFSASIRRSSMRDKIAISRKEALEEAQLRVSGASDDIEDEDPVSRLADVEHEINSRRTNDEIRTSDIKEVDLQIWAENKEGDENGVATQLTRPGTNTDKTTFPKESVSIVTETVSEKHEIATPNGPSKPSQLAVNNRDRGDIEKSNTRPAREIETKPVGETKKAYHGSKGTEKAVDKPAGVDPRQGSKPALTVSVNNTMETVNAPLVTPTKQPESKPGWTPNLSPIPSGLTGPQQALTLSELKRQRQLQLQQSMRLKDPSMELSRYTEEQPEESGTLPRNGQTVNGNNNISQSPYSPLEPPLRRYSAANAHEIIGSAEKEGCCVII